jgi:hypothetical protein
MENDEIIQVTCNGCQATEQVETWSDAKYHPWVRSDAYGLTTGCYCDECYENNYPYRKDRYYDPSYCGERMDDDY